MSRRLQEGDLTVRNGWLVECINNNGIHGYEPLANLEGMSLEECIAVVLDPTAALGTPEIVYRARRGETAAATLQRERERVMSNAQDIVRVIEASGWRITRTTDEEKT